MDATFCKIEDSHDTLNRLIWHGANVNADVIIPRYSILQFAIDNGKFTVEKCSDFPFRVSIGRRKKDSSESDNSSPSTRKSTSMWLLER